MNQISVLLLVKPIAPDTILDVRKKIAAVIGEALGKQPTLKILLRWWSDSTHGTLTIEYLDDKPQKSEADTICELLVEVEKVLGVSVGSGKRHRIEETYVTFTELVTFLARIE